MIIFTIIWMLPIGLFLGFIITCDLDGIKKAIVFTLVTIVSTGLIVGALILDDKIDNDRWNNGKCSIDNTELVFVNASHTRYNNTVYYYQCAHGHIYEFDYLHENIRG